MQQRRHEARLKILTTEVVSLELVSYPETKTATYAQEKINGATSGGRANKTSSHEESLETKASCFNLKKNKSWPIIFIALSTKMADVLVIITLRQF